MRISKLNKFSLRAVWCFDGEGPVTPSPVNEPAPSPVATPEPTPSPVAQPSPAPSTYGFMDYVPEEFRTSEYVTRAAATDNPVAELLKNMTTLQEGIINTPTIPKADATEDEIKAWAALVAPTDPGAYGDLKPVAPEGNEAVANLLDAAFTPELLQTITASAMELGVAPWQLKGIMDKVNANQIQVAEGILAQQAQQEADLNANFDEVMKKSFGKEQPKVVQLGKEFLRDMVPAHLSPYVASLSNEALAVVAAVAYQAHKKYGGEDTIPLSNTGGSIADSKIEMDKEIAEAMSDKAYTNAMMPEHEAAKARVRGLMETYVKKGYG